MREPTRISTVGTPRSVHRTTQNVRMLQRLTNAQEVSAPLSWRVSSCYGIGGLPTFSGFNCTELIKGGAGYSLLCPPLVIECRKIPLNNTLYGISIVLPSDSAALLSFSWPLFIVHLLVLPGLLQYLACRLQRTSTCAPSSRDGHPPILHGSQHWVVGHAELAQARQIQESSPSFLAANS